MAKTASDTGKGTSTARTAEVRTRVAQVVWLLAVLAAVILAIGALMVALDFNTRNGLVSFFIDAAKAIDFGSFKEFEPGKGKGAAHDALVKTRLVNWGIAAVIYLVVGKLLDRLIRP